MEKRYFLIFLILLFSCSGHPSKNQDEGTSWGPGAFQSNGERIYFTATSARGGAITSSTFTIDTMPMMMTRGVLACASCHGPGAHGGVHRMGMHTMTAPDIRWKTLNSMHHHEGAEAHAGEPAGEKFTREDFTMALREGKHSDGDLLSNEMPRWQMSDADIGDLAEYLLALP